MLRTPWGLSRQGVSLLLGRHCTLQVETNWITIRTVSMADMSGPRPAHQDPPWSGRPTHYWINKRWLRQFHWIEFDSSLFSVNYSNFNLILFNVIRLIPIWLTHIHYIAKNDMKWPIYFKTWPTVWGCIFRKFIFPEGRSKELTKMRCMGGLEFIYIYIYIYIYI